MLDRRIIELTRELRELYAKNCALADKLNGAIAAEHERVQRACRGRESAISELNYFTDVFARHEAMRTALNDPAVRLRNGVFQFACWAVIGVIGWQLMVVPDAVFLALGLIPILAGLACVLHRRFILGGGLFRRLLREQLVARGVPICLECGYDLRGQVEPRCPECGSAAPALRTAPARGEACHVR